MNKLNSKDEPVWEEVDLATLKVSLAHDNHDYYLAPK